MSARMLFAAILVLGVATTVTSAQTATQNDMVGWKTFRNETMGFEVKYPSSWHVRSVKGTGPETVLLDETPQVGKPHMAAQFWVQRQINPRSLPIEQWYADQLRRINASPPQTTSTSIGGRSAIRMETVGSLERRFGFFTSLNKTDIFEVTLTQPSSQTQVDPTYQKVLSSVRFTH